MPSSIPAMTEQANPRVARERAMLAVRNQMIGIGVPAGLISASGTAVSDHNDGRAVMSLHLLVKS
jgi:hypothetical protein